MKSQAGTQISPSSPPNEADPDIISAELLAARHWLKYLAETG